MEDAGRDRQAARERSVLRCLLVVVAALSFVCVANAALAHSHDSALFPECAACQAALAMSAGESTAPVALPVLQAEPTPQATAAPEPEPGAPLVSATRGPPAD
jgi:hypothetical protein